MPASPESIASTNALAAMIEHAPWPMAAVHGPAHILTQVNVALCKLLGRPAEELLGKRCAEVLPAQADWSTMLDRVYHTGHAERHMEEDRHGEAAIFSSTMWPVMEGGSPVGVVIQVMDAARGHGQIVAMNEALVLGALRQLEESEAARAEAISANRAKDQFLAILSHELRTPLTPVLIAVKSLMRSKDLPPLVAQALAMIEQNVLFEAQLINDLLDFSSIGFSKLVLAPKQIDVHEVIRTAVEVVIPDIGARNQRLDIALDAADYRMIGDGKRLQQVFINLLKNASKFTPAHGEIWVRSRNELNDPSRWTMEVADTGIGFSVEASQRIFEPFGQGSEAVTREFGGLGLGLAICKAIIDAHSGSFRAHSLGVDRGATFTVELPLSETPMPS